MSWYDSWHNHTYHPHVHWGTFIVTCLLSTSFLLTAINNSYADTTTGLVAHYKFDEGSGTTAGDSAGNNTGTLVNGPTWVAGKIGGALSFDGVDDRVTTNADIIETGNITACAWINPTSTGSANAFLGNVGFWVYLTSSGQVRTTSNNNAAAAISANNAYSLNQWVHTCIVRKAEGTSSIYVNGLASGAANQSTPIIDSAFNFAIGTRGSAAAFNFSGLIDDVRIYNRVLSASDITELYEISDGSTPYGTPYATPYATPPIATTNNYWVAPTGAATWANCKSDTPLSGASACSLATANANLTAGDTANLRGGTYTTHIFPAKSGTNLSQRITYVAYNGEVPVISNTTTSYATYYHGIALVGKNYIKIDGVVIDNPHNIVPSGKDRPLMITHGSSYNEIVNSTIDGNGSGSIVWWDGDSTDVGPQQSVTNNWIHNSTIANTGYVNSLCDDIGGFQIGVPAHDNESNNNTVENNIFYNGGHHNLETHTKYNVIRNNYFHNEGGMVNPGGCSYGPDDNGLYGNRNIQIYDGYGEDKYNLLERNRFGHAGPPPDDNGGDGLTITAPKNIIRHNTIFNSQNNGVLFKTGFNSLADNNRFYNNTIFKSGRYQNSGSGLLWYANNFRWYGGHARVGNVIKNNIFYQPGPGKTDFGGGSATIYEDNTVTNNFCTTSFPGKCSASGNPLFINTNVSDPTNIVLPDLSLQNSSPAIDGGTYLTEANGSGSNSTTLKVDDALYFQDGTWGSALSDIEPDWIAIGTVDNVVQINSINYSTNTITLTSPKSWSDNAKIWLYKDSNGTRVLYGNAPDYGASEKVVEGSPYATPYTYPTPGIPYVTPSDGGGEVGGDEPGQGVYVAPSTGVGGELGGSTLTEETKQALIIQIMLQIIELLTQLIIKLKSGAAAVVSALSGWGL